MIKLETDKLKNVKILLLDFDGVLTNNLVIVDQNGGELVSCNRWDGIGIKRIKDMGITSHIISSEVNPIVTARANKLNISCNQAVENKLEMATKICTNYGLKIKDAMFIANDINDVELLKEVGFAVGVADCMFEIDPYLHYKTKLKGGEGAVREMCDHIYFSRNHDYDKK